MPAPAHPHYLQLTLANGLRVSLRHAPRLKRCAAVLRVAAGSHDVPLAWPGLAHFLEHLLFLGTERFPAGDALMTYVQRHGGQVNASTRERTTDFFFEVPAPVFSDALQRLGDMLTHPRLAISDQRREREVLHAEFIAWSRDATSQQQFAVLQGLAADHPLRGFHAGNRYSLPVPREDFQQALHRFYADFYHSGQMTLSLAGPQSLEELEALARGFGAMLKQAPTRQQAAPAALMSGEARTYLHSDDHNLHQVIACQVPREALDFLCTWLNAPAAGGLLAHLQAQELASALRAAPLYHFAGQALLDIQFTLGANGAQQTPRIERLLHDWLSFFANSDWSLLREEYALLIARQQQVSGALALAQQDCEAKDCVLSDQAASALKTLLDSLQLPPSQHAWQLPPNNPFLRPSVTAQAPGLIRGQTSAHRGLRTFAQDRTRGRRALSTVTFSQAMPNDSGEGALYLRWRLDSAQRGGLFPRLENSLRTVQDHARQAGVEVSLEMLGTDWLLKLIGVHDPMSAVLEQLAQLMTQPDEHRWKMPLPTPAPLIAIRQLLKAFAHSTVAPQEANLADLQRLWATASWEGFGVGIPEAGQLAINQAAMRLPGQPASIRDELRSSTGQHHWQTIATDSSESALLLFCPTPTQSLIDEANWRLLGHLAQAPFYQRLRVELQLGYAVFSSVRQLNGQTGLLFGVQSPSVDVKAILEHIRAFLAHLPALIEASDEHATEALASQFDMQALPAAQAAETLWQARLAGHPSDYLQQLQGLVQSRTRQDLLNAADQLNQAEGGWRCLANEPCTSAPWLAPT